MCGVHTSKRKLCQRARYAATLNCILTVARNISILILAQVLLYPLYFEQNMNVVVGCDIRRAGGKHIPYSLDITPPSFISPPFHFARIRCEGIFISNLSPPDHGRTLRLRRTRGRLELTVPPYIECSYLLASDTPTKRLATRRQARS